jgi:carbon-monoxide dehydrogenase large subunit
MSQHLFNLDGVQVSRFEDKRLVTGAGTYASDWNLPGQLYAAFVRADRAHANILAVDVSQALEHPDVAGVYTGEDAVRLGYVKSPTMLTFPGKNGMKANVPDRPALAHGRVRYVGEAVAMVVATSAAAAQDAAELVMVDYEDLPHVVDAFEALAPDAPQLYDQVPGNLPFEYEAGDKAATDAAFARAAHVTRLDLRTSRVIANPLEPRACLVQYDPADGVYTMHTCVQGVNGTRMQLAAMTQLPPEKLRVIAKDVGGGFGQRSLAYAENAAMLIAAEALGKPIKWTSTRSEGFLADAHGRANHVIGELALDKDGRFLAIRLDWVADMGAYMSMTGAGHIRNPKNMAVGVYTTPQAYGNWRMAFTNTSPICAYRGAGRPDIAYVVERMVDNAAAEMNIDRVEIRRRNLIPPDAFPYTTPTGTVYENADLPGLLDKALKLADWDGYAARKADSEARGLLRGRGVVTVIENTGAGMFPKDQVICEVDRDGQVLVHTVCHAQGQGHETTFAMMAAKALGLPAERVRVKEGDIEHGLIGNHAGGSRSMLGAGAVCHLAAEKLLQQARARAAAALGAPADALQYSAGAFSAGKQRITLAQLAAHEPLSAMAEASFGSTYPNGCHIAEVEIDPQTGVTHIVAYTAVDDCGVVVNHTIVEGQVHGAIAQGAGQIFGEQIVYDPDSGQLLSGSFTDYFMPRAGMLPEIRMDEHPTASTVNPFGIKGAGESGCTGSLPVLANAVLDALRPLGIHHLDMPLSPARLWTAIAARRAAAQTA